MAFGKFFAIGPVNQRDMREDRHVPAHGLIDHHLTRRIAQVIVAADNMCDAHIMVIHDDREHVDRRAVRAQQDHVIELRVIDFHIALHFIADHHRAAFGCAHANNIRQIWVRRGIRITPRAAIERGFTLRTRALAEGFDFVLRRETFERFAIGEHFMGNFCMTFCAFKLADHIAVVIKSEPSHALQDCCRCFWV